MARKTSAAALAFMGMMVALVFVSNYVSIPTGYSRLHAANAVCILAGMLFGGVKGGIIAGLGSALFDLTFPAYAPEFWITFINKGAMALAAGLIVNDKESRLSPHLRAILGAATGAVLYIALYMIKSYVWARWVAPVPADTIPAVLIGKLSSSSINGLFATVAAPLLYAALHPALKRAGLWDQ
jgi:uncharacterized membrane protein